MAFKNEERTSGIISGAAIMRKVCDEKFENLVKEIKALNAEQRKDIVLKNLMKVIENFKIIWDAEPDAWVDPFVFFVLRATQLACAGLSEVTKERKEEIINYFSNFEAIQKIFKTDDEYFDAKKMPDESYQSLVEPMLTGSMQPFTSSYPNTLFTYMILVACADQVNEGGIDAIRMLRNDYINYVERNENGIEKEFKGVPNRLLFMSKEERKAKDEETKKKTREQAEKEQQERKEMLGKLNQLNVGETFLFGSYPQESKKTSQRIEWRVLDKQGSKILVLSQYVLDNQPFHKTKKTTAWGDSLIRTWLNQTFVRKAFMDEEKALIVPAQLVTPDSAGKEQTTTDSIFLLSESEVKKYFPNVQARYTTGTKVASNDHWGLRSYKASGESFQYIANGGRMMSNKFGTDDFSYQNYECVLGVRPAMWIETSRENLKKAPTTEVKNTPPTKKREETEAEKYKKAYDAWKKKCDEAIIQREARKKKLLEEAETENKRALERAEQAYRQSITQKKQHLEDEKRRKEEAEKKLGMLGFFAFGEKKDQKAIIEETARTIPQTQAAIEQAEADYQAELGKIAERLKKNKEEAESKAEREIPMPEKPLSPEESRRQKQEADWKNNILSVLSYSEPMSLEDIRRSNPELAELTVMQISRLLRELKREMEPEGIVVQRTIVNRKECYVLN